MAERIHKEKQKSKQEAAPQEDAPTEALETEADIDDILDEIDDVLEENAELFVSQYVQKGGQ